MIAHPSCLALTMRCDVLEVVVLLLFLSGPISVQPSDVAHLKPITQSGVFASNNASLAVDGDLNSCCIACTGCGDYKPYNTTAWVQIDLGNNYSVVNMTLIGSAGEYNRNYMQNFSVFVSESASTSPGASDLCYTYNTGPAIQNQSFVCLTNPMVGRYVTIRRLGGFRFDAISLCEVYVDGYVYNGTQTSSTTTRTTTSATLATNETVTVTSAWNLTTPSIPTAASDAPSDNATSATGEEDGSGDVGLSNTAVGAIIGVSVGVIVIIIGLILLYVCIKKSRFRLDGSPLGRRPSSKPIMVEDSSSIYAATLSMSDSPNRMISQSNFVSYLDELRRIPNGLQKEFKKLPDDSAGVAKLGLLPDNRLKNRFTNVLPYDHTIVPLEIEEDDDETATYINSNFITGYKKTARMYIAAQGPRPNTIDDFWRMIWQQNVNLIVMITQLIEKTKNKCEQYWPERMHETKVYRSISVTMTTEECYADFVDRQFIIQDERKEGEVPPRTIRQLQYLSWMDNGRPEHCFQLLYFRRKVKTLQMNATGPVVIHCSSGIGRTGAYIAVDFLLDQLASERSISVFRCVEELRRQRMNMVHTQDQYEFIYDTLVEEIEMGDTSQSCAAFVRDHPDSCQSNSSSTSILDTQFQRLKKVSASKPGRKSAGNDPDNVNKNRNTAIVAYDDSRTYLDVSYISRSDYVNAVSLNSYRAAHAYILTQVPLRNTIVDFWRLIWDYDLKTIVLLDDLTDSSSKYWSENSGSRTFGPFLVEMILSEQESQHVWRRQFVLTNTKEKSRESLSVNQFQLKNWLNKSSFRPEDIDTLLEMRTELSHWLDAQPTAERIVVQCIDGSTKSGLFVCALNTIDRIFAEVTVDVCLSCRHVRLHRPTAVNNLDHFVFLHEVARVCSGQMTSDGDGLQKRSSLTTLYASVRSTSFSASFNAFK